MIEIKTFHTPQLTEENLIQELFHFLKAEQFESAATTLQWIMDSEELRFLPRDVLEMLLKAIQTQDWEILSTPFLEKNFIGKNGRFLWIAPFSIRRQGKKFSELTGIYGQVLDLKAFPEMNVSKHLQKLQRDEGIPGEIIPFESIFTFGFTGTEEGEAFLVPNGWGFKNSKFGPALNDLRQQRERFSKMGLHAIRKIFEPKTAEILLSWTKTQAEGYETQNREYQFHELGHFTGVSLNQKIANKAFLTPWYAAVEEWRADGVGFEIARKTLSPVEASRMIAANLCLRFGVDAHRSGGIELDSDVNATLILFDRLLESGALSITENFQLTLELDGVEDLLDRVSTTIISALELTRSECFLQDPRGIWNLYGGMSISPVSRRLFDLLVRKPCFANTHQLR